MKFRNLRIVRWTMFLGAILTVLLIPTSTLAAQLYFSPKSGSFQPGETVSVELRIDNQGECINAADVSLGFSKENVEVVDVSRGDSIFSIWVTPPTVRPELGLINFVGGIPGGYCGRIPGDPSVTNVIATVILRFKNSIKTLPTTAKISALKTSKVILHDGLGTEAKLILPSAEFSITRTSKAQQNTWTEAIQNDKTPPEPFTIEVYRDKAVFEGKYFAIFSTVDKQTGLDRFEILETKKQVEDKNSQWKKGDSPYVLSDQTLRSFIKIRAIDKAGNIRTVEHKPNTRSTEEPAEGTFWALASLAFVFVVIMRILKFLPL